MSAIRTAARSAPARLAAAVSVAASLSACGDGGTAATDGQASIESKASLGTRVVPVPPRPPVPEDGRSSASKVPLVDGFMAKRPVVAYASECVVDFTDPTALQMTEPSLWFDRIYVPWYQQCGGLGFVDVRPLVLDHVHVSFADSDVQPCFTHPQAYPSRIAESGFCDHVDIPTEPRSHMTAHLDIEVVRIIAEKADHTTRAAFDLNRIRIPGAQPVRLCYKKRVEGPVGPWEAAEPGAGSPGTWLCWSHLDPGTWNLSDWVWDVTEVKITGVPGVSVNFALDDLHVGIR